MSSNSEKPLFAQGLGAGHFLVMPRCLHRWVAMPKIIEPLNKKKEQSSFFSTNNK
jgi:hypothetical protein